MLGSPPAPSPFVIFAPMWIFLSADESASACASVLIAMNSTPRSPAEIIRLTALLPPPPTPTTLIAAYRRRSRSTLAISAPPVSDFSSSAREDVAHPGTGAIPERTAAVAVHRSRVIARPRAVERQPDTGAEGRTAHRLDQTGDLPGPADSPRKAQTAFDILLETFEQWRAAGPHA